MDRDDGMHGARWRDGIRIGVVWVLLAVTVSGCGSGPTRGRGGTTEGYGASAAPEPRRAFAWPEGTKAAVSLTFDDARASQVENGVPLLDRYGVKATFYVVPDRLGERLAAWKQAAANGHEIGNHTVRHPCTGNFAFAREKALEDYTREEMERELLEANRRIEAALGVRPRTFAYPCGQKFVGRGTQLRSYVPVVAWMFSAGRGWMDEAANDPAFCDPAQLLGVELDGLDFEAARKLIETAAANGGWLVFAGHDIGEGGRQTTRIDTLEAICEYAKDPNNGIWIDTVENVVRYVRERR